MNEFFIWEENKNILPNRINFKHEENVKCDIMNETNPNVEKKHLNDITPKNSGIYKIVNKINGKYYVGRTNNFEERWLKHKSDLIKNRHHNDVLQRAWNKHGENNFEFIIIERTQSLLKELEQTYLTIAENEQDKCYNLNFNALYGNDKLSERSREKIRKSRIGKKHSVETKNKISSSKSGINHHLFGKKHSVETRLKMSEVHKGKKHSFESRNKISESKKGKPISPETKLKISNSIKNKKRQDKK